MNNQKKTNYFNHNNYSKILLIGIILSLLVLLIINLVPTVFISARESLFLLGVSLGWLIGLVLIVK